MRFILFALLLCLSVPAYALTQEEGADAPTRSVEDLIEQYIDLPKDAVDWKVFAKTKEINQEGTQADGLQYQYYKPGFPPELLALDGKEVVIKGYMFPLDETEDQRFFLLGPFPINCPFQYHVGPSLVVEVKTAGKSVPFDYEPITLKGRLELVKSDPENSTFYRLIDASKI